MASVDGPLCKPSRSRLRCSCRGAESESEGNDCGAYEHDSVLSNQRLSFEVRDITHSCAQPLAADWYVVSGANTEIQVGRSRKPNACGRIDKHALGTSACRWS